MVKPKNHIKILTKKWKSTKKPVSNPEIGGKSGSAYPASQSFSAVT